MTSRKPVLIKSTLLAPLILVASILVAPVLSAGPHFFGTPTIIKNPNFSLTVNFKATGLGSKVTRVALVSGNITAKLQCLNPNGNNPPSKQISLHTFSNGGTFQPHNGQIAGSVSTEPPDFPSASQICPNSNWEVKVVSVTYDNVVLIIQQNGQNILTFNFGNVDP